LRNLQAAQSAIISKIKVELGEALYQRKKKKSSKTARGMYPQQPSPMPDFYEALAAKESEIDAIRETCGFLKDTGGPADTLPSDLMNNQQKIGTDQTAAISKTQLIR